MNWQRSNRADPRALALADRHYSRQKPGTPQFVRNASNIVMLTPRADALWVSIFERFARHDWRGAVECALFRNEGTLLSSTLIREAIAATLYLWPSPPLIITMIDEDKVRHKRDPGRCFRKAGFTELGRTRKRKRLVLGLSPLLFPAPEPLIDATRGMFAEEVA